MTLTKGIINYKLRFSFNEFVNIKTSKVNKVLLCKSQFVVKEQKIVLKNITFVQIDCATWIVFALLGKAHSTALISLAAERHTSVCLSLVVKPLSRGSHPVSQTIKKHHHKGDAFLLAALHGFEPRLTESESAVLPLDDSAIGC